MTNFHVGEKIVYPNQGVGTIETISTRSFGAQMERFYLLRLGANSMTVMVPFSHVDDIGLRKITKNAEVAKVMLFLGSGNCKLNPDWKDRFKQNTEKMRMGTLVEIAEVLKGLLILQIEKPLSFREKKMLDRARHMLITEISVVRAMPESSAVDLLCKTLAKSNLALPPAL